MVAACNLNEIPAFDDSEAFVAFDKIDISVNEDAATLRIPVRLTSLGNKTATVSYQVFEGPRPAPGAALDAGAQEGRDYELAGGSSVLTFTANNPVQYIEFDVLSHTGEFTGDRTFGIKITNGGGVNLGAADSAAVTILDLDHPLSFILGNFRANGTSYFNGASQWTVVFAKDASDVTKVWITNLVLNGSSSSRPVYGIVNAEKTEIRIPVGQEIAVSASYPDGINLEGFYGPGGDDLIPSGGYITGSIDPSGTISILDWFGSNIAGTNSWYNIFVADVVLTKQ